VGKKKNKSTVLPLIQGIAKGVYSKILKKKSPELVSPLRSLSNVKYDAKDGYFELLGKKKKRSLTAATVKSFSAALERAWAQSSALETMGNEARAAALKKIDPQPGKTLLNMMREAAHKEDKKAP